MTEPAGTNCPSCGTPAHLAGPAFVLNSDAALANAARLLRNAEMDTNLAVMERLGKLADSWIGLAAWLVAREQQHL